MTIGHELPALLMNIFNHNINVDYLTYLTKTVIQLYWTHESRGKELCTHLPLWEVKKSRLKLTNKQTA